MGRTDSFGSAFSGDHRILVRRGDSRCQPGAPETIPLRSACHGHSVQELWGGVQS